MHNVWTHAPCMPRRESFTFQLHDRWPLQVQVQHETRPDLSVAISCFFFSDFGRKLYFHHIILMQFNLTFCSVSAFVFAHYNEHFVLFCFRPEIQMEDCDRNGRWINFPNTVYLAQSSGETNNENKIERGHKSPKTRFELRKHACYVWCGYIEENSSFFLYALVWLCIFFACCSSVCPTSGNLWSEEIVKFF